MVLKYIAPKLHKNLLLKRIKKVGHTTVGMHYLEGLSASPLIFEPEHGMTKDFRKFKSLGDVYILYKSFGRKWAKYFKEGIPENCDVDPEFLTEASHLCHGQLTAYGSRARFFQEVVREALWGQGINQIVLINAYADSLPYRFQLGEHMRIHQAFLHEKHKTATMESFKKVQLHGNVSPVVLDYSDPQTWLKTLEENGFNPEEKACFVMYHLSRMYSREEQKQLHDTLAVLPQGSLVCSEFWGATLWGYDVNDIDPMKGTVYPFELLLDEPSELFNESEWDTVKHTPRSLNYENRASKSPPGTHSMIFSLSTRKGKVETIT